MSISKKIQYIQKLMGIIERKNNDCKHSMKIPVTKVTSEEDVARLRVLEREFNTRYSYENIGSILKDEKRDQLIETLWTFTSKALDEIQAIFEKSKLSLDDVTEQIKIVIEASKIDADDVAPSIIPSTYQGIAVKDDDGNIRHITMEFFGKCNSNKEILGRFFEYLIGDTTFEQINGLGFKAVIVYHHDTDEIAKFGHVSDLQPEREEKYTPYNNGILQKKLFRKYLESCNLDADVIESYVLFLNVLLPKGTKVPKEMVKLYLECFKIEYGIHRHGRGPSVYFDSDNMPMPISVDYDDTFARFKGCTLKDDPRSAELDLTEFGKWLVCMNDCVPYRITTGRSSSCSYTGEDLLILPRKASKHPELILGISNPDHVLRGAEPSIFKCEEAEKNGCYIHYDDDKSLVARGQVTVLKMVVDNLIQPPGVGVSETSYNPDKIDLTSAVIIGNVGSGKSIVTQKLFDTVRDLKVEKMWFGHDSSRVCTPNLAFSIAESYAMLRDKPVYMIMDQADVDLQEEYVPKFNAIIQLTHVSPLFNLVSIMSRRNHDNLNGFDDGDDEEGFNEEDCEYGVDSEAYRKRHVWPPVRHSWDLHRMPITRVVEKFIACLGRKVGLKALKDWCMENSQRLSIVDDDMNFLRLTYLEGRRNARKTNEHAFYNSRQLVLYIDDDERCYIISEGPPLTKEVSIAEKEVTDQGEALDNSEMDRQVHPEIQYITNVVEGNVDFVPLMYYAKTDGSTLKAIAITAKVYKKLVNTGKLTDVDILLMDKCLEVTGGVWTVWHTSSGSMGLGNIVDKFVLWLWKIYGGSEMELMDRASGLRRKRGGSRNTNDLAEIKFMLDVLNHQIEEKKTIIDTWSSRITKFFEEHYGGPKIVEYLTSTTEVRHATASFELRVKDNSGLFGRDSVLAIASPVTDLTWLGTVTTDVGWVPSTAGSSFQIPYAVHVDSPDKMTHLHQLTRMVAEGLMTPDEFNTQMPSVNRPGTLETPISEEGWMIGFTGETRLIKGKADFYYATHKPWYQSSTAMIKEVVDTSTEAQLESLKKTYPAVSAYVKFVTTFKWHSIEEATERANDLITDDIFTKDKKPIRKELVRKLIAEGNVREAFRRCGKVIGTQVVPEALKNIISVELFKQVQSGTKGERELMGIIMTSFADAHSSNPETFKEGLNELKRCIFTVLCRNMNV